MTDYDVRCLAAYERECDALAAKLEREWGLRRVCEEEWKAFAKLERERKNNTKERMKCEPAGM